jgi:hypothetical protein
MNQMISTQEIIPNLKNQKMRKISNFKMFFSLAFMLAFVSFAFSSYAAPKQMYYEIKIYRVNSPSQESRVDAYLKDAFLPALHRAGIPKVAVFKPVENDTAFGKIVYVFIPYKNFAQYEKLVSKLNQDNAYQQAGKSFLDAPYNDPPFARHEDILLRAFSQMPVFKVHAYSTPPSQRIYELRSYESGTEAKALKKIQMFNEGGEMAIFEKIGSNAVFYGQVIFGSQKPRLMYLTTYSDMKSHDEHWNAFRNAPEWKVLSGMDEYKNSTSKTKAFLCHPTDYSDF